MISPAVQVTYCAARQMVVNCRDIGNRQTCIFLLSFSAPTKFRLKYDGQTNLTFLLCLLYSLCCSASIFDINTTEASQFTCMFWINPGCCFCSHNR